MESTPEPAPKTVRQAVSTRTFGLPQPPEEKGHNVISSQEYLNKKEELETHRQDAIAYLRDKINSTIQELAKFGVKGEFHESFNLKELQDIQIAEEILVLDEPPVVDTAVPIGDFECSRCGRVFATEWGLKMHHARTKGGNNPKCKKRSKANGRA